MKVHGSRFRVQRSCLVFAFGVRGSGFEGSGFQATSRQQPQNRELGTMNLELELRTRTMNREPGALNGPLWQ
jgi:hypothetical protein